MQIGNKQGNWLTLGKGEYLYMYDYNQVINTCIKNLFTKYANGRELTIKDVDINEEIIKNKIMELPQMIFESTRNCNLRCKYCVYNDNYSNQRSVSPIDMSFEIARKSIDYVFSFIKDRKKKEFSFGFYGGEPFLNIRTIKKIVEYVKQQYDGWQLLFNMTTNLTLLDNRILDFLVENNFILLVSLDGNRYNHDAKRISVNGKGTHDLVMKNLEKIKKRDGDYFQQNVGFSIVYSYDLPLMNLYQFFTTTDFIKKLPVRFGAVDMYNTDYYKRYPYNIDEFGKDYKNIFLNIREKIRSKEEMAGFERFLYNTFKGIGDTLNNREFCTVGSSCLFDSRLYVDVYGHFHICEKMNDTFDFGDVVQGFNWKKMANIVRKFKEVIKTHCLKCDIRFLCSRCYVAFMGNGEFNLNPVFCKNQRKGIISQLNNFIEWKEEKLV